MELLSAIVKKEVDMNNKYDQTNACLAKMDETFRACLSTLLQKSKKYSR
jgi:hypothetical protein